MRHPPCKQPPWPASATARAAGVLLAAVLLLAACTDGNATEVTETASPTPATSTPTAHPQPPTFDDEAAARLYVAWRNSVYALPPTAPEALDSDAVGDTTAVPGSEASDWVVQELEGARDSGVLARGEVHAEAVPPVRAAGDQAAATICSAADLRFTDVATGEPVSDEVIDPSYTRVDVAYRRVGDAWLIESATPGEDRLCVPPTIEATVAARWEPFTQAWYERDRQGGGEDLGQLEELVTERFADTLRGFASRDPVADPAPYADFELIRATPTTATGQACRHGGLETVEWLLVQGQWRVDFVGQTGQEATPCP